MKDARLGEARFADWLIHVTKQPRSRSAAGQYSGGHSYDVAHDACYCGILLPDLPAGRQVTRSSKDLQTFPARKNDIPGWILWLLRIPDSRHTRCAFVMCGKGSVVISGKAGRNHATPGPRFLKGQRIFLPWPGHTEHHETSEVSSLICLRTRGRGVITVT